MESIQPTPSQAAFVLKRFMAEQGVTVPLASAQEAVARMLGFANWQALVAVQDPRIGSLPGCLKQKDETTYILSSGPQSYAHLEIQNMCISIKHEDEGVVVDVYAKAALNSEVDCLEPLATLSAAFNDATPDDDDDTAESNTELDYAIVTFSEVFGADVFNYSSAKERDQGLTRLLERAKMLEDGIHRTFVYSEISSDLANDEVHCALAFNTDPEAQVFSSLSMYCCTGQAFSELLKEHILTSEGVSHHRHSNFPYPLTVYNWEYSILEDTHNLSESKANRPIVQFFAHDGIRHTYTLGELLAAKWVEGTCWLMEDGRYLTFAERADHH